MEGTMIDLKVYNEGYLYGRRKIKYTRDQFTKDFKLGYFHGVLEKWKNTTKYFRGHRTRPGNQTLDN